MVDHGQNHGLFWVILLQYCDLCKGVRLIGLVKEATENF